MMQLLTIAGIGRELGVSRQLVGQWAGRQAYGPPGHKAKHTRPGFPKPAALVDGTPVYLREEILEWAANRKRPAA